MTGRSATIAMAILAGVLAPHPASCLGTPALWALHELALDEALAYGDIPAAVQQWHHGLAAALRSRSWLGLVESGDASLRIAEARGLRGQAKPLARSLYLEALIQAKSQGSVEGALRVAAAFGRLGDRAVAEQCVRVADAAARRRRDAHALRDVAMMRERLLAEQSPESQR